MRKTIALLLITTILVLWTTVGYCSRIKDIARFQGVRPNQLMGFGLIGGLAGTGDNPKDAPFTPEAIANMLKQFGFDFGAGEINVKNFAAVMVTADLPAFIQPGDRIDLTVSSIGSAKSLSGGTLFRTLLKGLDGNIYAVGQGSVSLGGEVSGGTGSKNKHLTVGRVINGAIVERAVPVSMVNGGTVKLEIAQPDITTASRVADVASDYIRSYLYRIGKKPEAGKFATALDGATVEINVADVPEHNLIPCLAGLEKLEIEVDIVEKIIINEKTGTIVAGSNIDVRPVSISQNGISITIHSDGGMAKTVVARDKRKSSKDEKAQQVQAASDKPQNYEGEPIKGKVTLSNIVDALAILGVTPSELISIIQALKSAGAINAPIEII